MFSRKLGPSTLRQMRCCLFHCVMPIAGVACESGVAITPCAFETPLSNFVLGCQILTCKDT